MLFGTAGVAGALGMAGAAGALGTGASGAAAPMGSLQKGHFVGSMPSTGNTVLPHAQSKGSTAAEAGLKHIAVPFVKDNVVID